MKYQGSKKPKEEVAEVAKFIMDKINDMLSGSNLGIFILSDVLY